MFRVALPDGNRPRRAGPGAAVARQEDDVHAEAVPQGGTMNEETGYVVFVLVVTACFLGIVLWALATMPGAVTF